MSNLTDMIVRVSADRGTIIDADSSPTTTEVDAWLNDGQILIASLLCPQPLGDGKMTVGRLDKLSLIIEEELEAPSTGVCTLPAASVIMYLINIEFKTSSVFYPAQILTHDQVRRAQADTVYGADTGNPVCAFGEGELIYAPTAITGADSARFTFVEMPTTMGSGGVENFSIDLDLMIPCQEWAIYKMWSQGNRDLTKAGQALNAFIYIMGRITGMSQEQIRNAIPK